MILLLTAATAVLASLAARARMTSMRFIGVLAVTALASAVMSPAVGHGLGRLALWYEGREPEGFPVSRLQIELLGAALDAFRTDVGRYPTTAEGLRALRVRPPDVDRWGGPYLKKDVPPASTRSVPTVSPVATARTKRSQAGTTSTRNDQPTRSPVSGGRRHPPAPRFPMIASLLMKHSLV